MRPNLASDSKEQSRQNIVAAPVLSADEVNRLEVATPCSQQEYDNWSRDNNHGKHCKLSNELKINATEQI